VLRDRNDDEEVTGMGERASGNFDVKTWDEKSYVEIEGGGKLTRASVTQSMDGDFEGEATTEYLMCYREDGTASYVGLQRVVGRLGGRAGSFVLQVNGAFDGGVASGALTVVSGSGTGDLRGLRGQGSFGAPIGSRASVTLDYEIE
jgi:hypothetical protein